MAPNETRDLVRHVTDFAATLHNYTTTLTRMGTVLENQQLEIREQCDRLKHLETVCQLQVTEIALLKQELGNMKDREEKREQLTLTAQQIAQQSRWGLYLVLIGGAITFLATWWQMKK